LQKLLKLIFAAYLRHTPPHCCVSAL